MATAWRLIDSADIVIENFRPGVMDRLGLGVEAMTRRNPGLIYCTIPGFAADDPRAALRAWEGILDAATENCIPRAGEPPPQWDATRPTYTALSLASNVGGFLAATAIVMALIARQRAGKGQHVNVPLFDAMFTLIGHSGAYLNARGLRRPSGIHGRGAGCYRCGDGKYVQFDMSSPRHLTWFAREAGITVEWGPELLDLDRNADPEVNQQLHARLRELFVTRSAAAWEDIGNRAGAAIGWVRTVAEWIRTPHARALGAVVQLDDPEFGPTWMAGLPVRLTGSPGVPQGPRRRPDADHAEIVAELDRLPPRPLLEAPKPDLVHPLQGLQVIDLCLALAGPTCGRLLHEFGAEVIKVQQPNAGIGGYLNRGKRSLLLDLRAAGARQVFWRMVDTADIVLENFAPGTADRLGIGYDEVRARRPGIVYTSISCYGQIGPWRGHRGWERQGQASLASWNGLVPFLPSSARTIWWISALVCSGLLPLRLASITASALAQGSTCKPRSARLRPTTRFPTCSTTRAWLSTSRAVTKRSGRAPSTASIRRKTAGFSWRPSLKTPPVSPPLQGCMSMTATGLMRGR